MNLAALVDEHAARYGDRVLAIFDDDTVTYEQVPAGQCWSGQVTATTTR